MIQSPLPITALPDEIDLLIEARWVVPVIPSGVILEEHTVAVHQGRILALIPRAESLAIKARERRILPEHLLIPGLVNAHGHTGMSLFRGLADDLPLMTWLGEHIWPAEARWVDPAFVRCGTELAIAEMLRGGTTCFADMYFYPEVAARTALEHGIRIQAAFPVADRPFPGASSSQDAISRGLRLHDELRHSSLASVAFGPHAPYTVNDQTLLQVRTLADELDLPVHIHLHETASEVSEALSRTGKRPIQRLHDLGLLSPRLQAVHMTQVDEQDLQLLVDFGVQVIHCPESNLKLASGYCPVSKLLAAGVNVALGTDGPASNNDLDLLGELRTAALLAKGMSADPRALDAHAALYMATLAGARALGLADEIGSLEAGKSADLVAVDLSAAAQQPVYNPVSQLLYTCTASQVSDVWIAGKEKLRERKLVRLDQHAVLAEAREWAQRIQRGDKHDS